MMLYKSTHLTDFEKIRLGKSNLDFLYKLSREMVVSNIKRLESECGKIRYRLARIDGVTTRSKQLGEKLICISNGRQRRSVINGNTIRLASQAKAPCRGMISKVLAFGPVSLRQMLMMLY
ncbi:hypothetical protein [Aeromonas veronii]|nr:hypothetical protein [Aeromonas veronii]